MTRVLLVDDEPVLLDLGRQILERKFGFSIDIASSGEEALSRVQSVRFDAIISDYAMPVMDGLDLLRKIREKDKQIPFILFTVKEREEVVIEAINSGANFYVQKEEKPHVAFAELAHKVTQAVELVRAEKNLRTQRDLAIACANSKDMEHILSLCIDAAKEASEFDAGAIYLTNEEEHLALASHSGFSSLYSGHTLQAHLIPLFYTLVRNQESIYRDYETLESFSRVLITEEKAGSDAILSITHHGRWIGLIHLASHTNQKVLSDPFQRFLSHILVQMAGHISDRIAEDALRESERTLATLIGNLPGMVYKCAPDNERTMEFVSEGCMALTGYPPKDLLFNQDRSFGSLIHPDDRVRMMEVINRALDRHAQFKLTYRLLTSSMKFRWVWEQGAGVYDDNGDLLSLEGFIIDITRQKVLDDQVKVSQHRLNMLFSNMNSGCAIFRETEEKGAFALIEMNSAAEAIEGRKKEDLKGRLFSDIFGHIADGALIHALNEMVKDEIPRTLSRILVEKKEGKRWREAYLSTSHLGNSREIFLIYNDVTDRVRDEESIIASLREKELLLKEVHHRVKNNLQIISGILKLQSMRTTDPITNEIIQDCRNQVYTMASIHELLYNSVDIGNIQVADYINNLINHMKQEYEGTDTIIDFIVKVDPNIYLDIERCIPCGLILNELITNAVKYAFESGGTGEVRVMFSHEDHTYIMSVSDNGRGLPKDFDVRTVKSLGTELVSRLTHQLRGDIKISGDPGTTVTVRFNEAPGKKVGP
ncbi:MAG TPA: response regulator [Methanospirillum sp.]|nr:response regulator [Methanospirillum sp.]